MALMALPAAPPGSHPIVVKHANNNANCHRQAGVLVALTAYGCSQRHFAGRRGRYSFLPRRVRVLGIDLAQERKLKRPRSAPGPGEELLQTAKTADMLCKRLESELENAAGSAGAPSIRERLQKAKEIDHVLQNMVEDANEELVQYPVPDFLPMQGDVNVAVTGNSGVGKSAFINAVRKGLREGHDDLAETGILETTRAPRSFKFKKEYYEGDVVNVRDDDSGDVREAKVIQKVQSGYLQVEFKDGRRSCVDPDRQLEAGSWARWLWDLPGVGTTGFPQSDYIKKMGIRHFDVVVLMTAGRFTEAEARLLDELLIWGVPFFVVRNKVDVDLENEAEAQGLYGDILDPECAGVKEKTLHVLKSFLTTQLRQQRRSASRMEAATLALDANAMEDRVYCISSRPKYKNDFDMEKLRNDIWVAVGAQRLTREAVIKELEKSPQIKFHISRFTSKFRDLANTLTNLMPRMLRFARNE